QQRRSTSAERGGDGALASRLDLELRKRQPCAPLGQRARGRRKALALGQRPRNRGQPFAGRPELLVVDRRQPQRFRAKALEQRFGCLAAQLQAIGRAPQPVQRGGRLLTLPRGVGKILLGLVAFDEQLLELRVRGPPRHGGGGSALLDLRGRLA